MLESNLLILSGIRKLRRLQRFRKNSGWIQSRLLKVYGSTIFTSCLGLLHGSLDVEKLSEEPCIYFWSQFLLTLSCDLENFKKMSNNNSGQSFLNRGSTQLKQILRMVLIIFSPWWRTVWLWLLFVAYLGVPLGQSFLQCRPESTCTSQRS